MRGALPLFLTLGLILEEGFPIEHKNKIIDSVAEASHMAKISIVAGDTKVVPRGHIDKLFINTSGKDSMIIGEVTADNVGKVLLKTKIGGTRILSMLTGEQLPRIC